MFAVIWSRDRNDVPFEEHYRSLLDQAYYVGFRFFSGNNHLAEEVAQETLTRAYERWDRVARHPNREAWVMNAAWKVSMEIGRRQSRPSSSGLIDLVGLGEDLVVERPVLIAALSRLTVRQRTVAVARYYFGYDVAETASLLGMNESQVRTASHEATLKLRRLLGDRAVSDARSNETSREASKDTFKGAFADTFAETIAETIKETFSDTFGETFGETGVSPA